MHGAAYEKEKRSADTKRYINFVMPAKAGIQKPPFAGVTCRCCELFICKNVIVSRLDANGGAGQFPRQS